MKRKQFDELTLYLSAIANGLQRQAEVMERSDARIEEQIKLAEERQKARQEAIQKMFKNAEAVPGADMLILDSEDDDKLH